MRLKIIRLIIIISFLAISLGLVFLQVVQGKYYQNLSLNNRIRVVPVEGRVGASLTEMALFWQGHGLLLM